MKKSYDIANRDPQNSPISLRNLSVWVFLNVLNLITYNFASLIGISYAGNIFQYFRMREMYLEFQKGKAFEREAPFHQLASFLSVLTVLPENVYFLLPAKNDSHHGLDLLHTFISGTFITVLQKLTSLLNMEILTVIIFPLLLIVIPEFL